MLSGGYAPCLPQGPIVRIKLQGAVDGYKTDDCKIITEDMEMSKELMQFFFFNILAIINDFELFFKGCQFIPDIF
jgi:hypothetical protein